jgi:micrococcal nuclease
VQRCTIAKTVKNKTYECKELQYRYEYGIVTRIVDGDGICVVNLTSEKELEIRLLGIDAPEVSNCKKLREDERETHMPGGLLLELGRASKLYLQMLLPIGTKISYVSAVKSSQDVYGRLLAYVYLNDGRCINQEIVRAGYAKAFDKYDCDQLSLLIALNAEARREHRGIINQ